jgi:dTDP-4-amino-4,6-dideoxygalactose transaminase
MGGRSGEHDDYVPFFRPSIGDDEVREVVDVLKSGWLTTGPRVLRFEKAFAEAVGAKHAVALNSATAALHLGAEALGLRRGQAVLVPTMTFAATAEIMRYVDAHPILVDCDPVTMNLDLDDAERKIDQLRAGTLPSSIPRGARVVGLAPVHVGGLMLDIGTLRAFAERHDLWLLEDAAHAFPAAWRSRATGAWERCGEGTADISCFSFYANKTITTGEGGMAVTNDAALADRIRLMSLHGLSQDAWERYSGKRGWDYRIVAPGYKYNLTDIAAAIGIHQVARAVVLRNERENLASAYFDGLRGVSAMELPPRPPDRLHAWHLFSIRLVLDALRIDRNEFVDELKRAGVGCAVHWRPLHLHPYYEELGWRAEHAPVATASWERLVSLPLFARMRPHELDRVISVVRDLCRRHAR